MAMPAEQLRQFLNQNEINYLIIQHSPAFTAQGIAQAAHVSGRQFAKTVMVSLNGCLALVAIPAMRRVDLPRLARAVGATRAVLASESEFQDRFPGCDLGAMPPFGNLFGMETYVSRELSRAQEIAFNAGSQSEVMLLAWQDYLRLVQPKVLDF
ncbi:MAG: YbaK/EbsC family protein [Nitrococcus sp.]|nr:YbaK/EbsC family protein [Nitrococcus sp.]